MIRIRAKLQRRGKLFYVEIPSELIRMNNMKAGDEISLLIVGRKANLSKIFGTYKSSKSVDELMKEMDEELYDDW